MIRAGMIVLGLGLMALWLVGVAGGEGTWLLWGDFAAGVLALSSGLNMSRAAVRRGATAQRSGPPLALAVSLALWITALALRGPDWQTWWTFALASGALLLTVLSGSAERPPIEMPRLPRPMV